MKIGAALLAAGLLFAGGLWGSGAQAADVRLVVGQADKPALLNPLQVPAGGRETRAIKRQIFDALVVQNNELQPQPQLAASWTVTDETMWTFTLRDDVKFHNGEPFNAEAAKFNLDLILAPDSKASWHSQLSSIIESVEVSGEYELKVKTFKPAPTLLVMIAFQEIVPPKYYQEVGPDGFEAAPIGSGPFEFVSRDGSTVTVKRNESYWGGPAVAAELVFRTIPEVSSRIAALKAGEINIADKVPSDLSGELTGNAKAVIATGTRIYFLAMNVDQAPFDDPEVRRAVAAAVDRDLLVSALYGGNARPLNQPAFPEMFGYQPDAAGFKYDPDLAKAGLAGVTVPVKIDVRQADLVLAQATQGFLSQAGLNAEVQLVEDAAFDESIQAGRSQAYVSSWGVAEGDLDAILSRHFWSGRAATSSYTNYKSEELDRLFAAARATTDRPERARLYAEAIDILVADAPWATLVNPSEIYGVSANLTGWEPQATGIYFLTKATLQ